MNQDKTLDQIRDIIIKTVHPDKIILFGSRATGKNRDDSDYDIFVIKSGITNERVVSADIYMALLDIEVGNSVDIVASSPEKFEKNKDNPYMIYNDVDNQGVTIYG
ncbi:MAG: nucleotidyltransferase domain-containing protein [Spirochaetaceae bacterium]